MSISSHIQTILLIILTNLPVINGLCMSAFTLGWLITASHQPPNTPLAQTLNTKTSAVFVTGWTVTTLALIAYHCMYLAHLHRHAKYHWAGMPPQGIFILKIVAFAMFIFIAVAWQHTSAMTPHLALTFGLPVVSASALMVVLWDRSPPVQVQVSP